MRALVVYESMYGNTHAIACAIAAGLRATHEVTLVPVSAATPELPAEADLLIVGGPTHMHGAQKPCEYCAPRAWLERLQRSGRVGEGGDDAEGGAPATGPGGLAVERRALRGHAEALRSDDDQVAVPLQQPGDAPA
jgi:hypothetical protein